MGIAPPLSLSAEQRQQLERWSRGGSTPYRLVVRSQIILLAATGASNRRIARHLRTNPITVARWRSRFGILGLEGIRTEAPRSGSPPPIADDVVRAILFKTVHERPPGRSHWSTRTLARAVGVSHSTVRRVWKRYDVRPNRSRVALLAEKSPLRAKKIDVVGLYLHPDRKAIAFSFEDEAPRPPGVRDAAHRPWLKDLVTTLNLLDQRNPQGPPLRSSHRYVNQEFLTFLRSVQEGRTGDARIHLLAESEGGELGPALVRWLSRHPQVSARVREGGEPWKKQVAEWISELSATRSGSSSAPASLPSLRSALERWARDNRESPPHFAWTRD